MKYVQLGCSTVEGTLAYHSPEEGQKCWKEFVPSEVAKDIVLDFGAGTYEVWPFAVVKVTEDGRWKWTYLDGNETPKFGVFHADPLGRPDQEPEAIFLDEEEACKYADLLNGEVEPYNAGTEDNPVYKAHSYFVSEL